MFCYPEVCPVYQITFEFFLYIFICKSSFKHFPFYFRTRPPVVGERVRGRRAAPLRLGHRAGALPERGHSSRHRLQVREDDKKRPEEISQLIMLYPIL